MNIKRETRTKFLIFCLAWHFSVLNMLGGSEAADTEPVAYMGHGAFFDREGNQINLTQEFIERAQAYYRQRLLSSVPPDKSANFLEVEKGLAQTLTSSRQNRLVLQNRFIASLVPNSSDPDVGRIGATINALEYAMELQVPERAETGAPIRKFIPDPQVRDLIEKQTFLSQQVQPLAATLKGQQYIDECVRNKVPIPPPVGRLDQTKYGTKVWKSLGFIPQKDQFITGTPAELRVFTSPEGMCFALPRYEDDSKTTVILDGIICLGKETSKVCIWDNQMPGWFGIKSFKFPADKEIPIGLPDKSVDDEGRYQAGAFEFGDNGAGICTDCHAGENPYIIHPKVDLGGGVFMGDLKDKFPTFSKERYSPIVLPSWPQNRASLPDSLVPNACSDCHTTDREGGRFPPLTPQLKGYCGSVLAKALGKKTKTMPPSGPPMTEKDLDEVEKFFERCLAPEVP